jgi:hypothetical protein
MSAEYWYSSPLSTSGGIHAGVPPHDSKRILLRSLNSEKAKSQSLMLRSRSKSTFCDFISRWHTFARQRSALWHTWAPPQRAGRLHLWRYRQLCP